jgi:hypothetical protein
MMQTELLTKRNIATIGEEITHELGAEFIRDYQQAHPTDVKAYVIGKDIINQILAQPGCVGIQFYNAINELGEKTLVYVGLDANSQPIIKYTSINQAGVLSTEKAIVADRAGSAPTSDDPCIWYVEY